MPSNTFSQSWPSLIVICGANGEYALETTCSVTLAISYFLFCSSYGWVCILCAYTVSIGYIEYCEENVNEHTRVYFVYEHSTPERRDLWGGVRSTHTNDNWVKCGWGAKHVTYEHTRPHLTICVGPNSVALIVLSFNSSTFWSASKGVRRSIRHSTNIYIYLYSFISSLHAAT